MIKNLIKYKFSSAKNIHEPFKLGDLSLKNRFVMAPMTRQRADPDDGIPNDLMADYYSQRSTFGLIITECSQISPLSNSFPGSGGIHNEQQAMGWKKVVDKVHQNGSKIVLQIFHSGRAAPTEYLNGQQPIAPSPIAISTPHKKLKKPYPFPKEMTQEDINTVLSEFQQSAKYAKQAGFDGVQLHASNGYLIDQFLRSGPNKRRDGYGGSIENRCRFLFECIEAVNKEFNQNQISVRLNPTGRYNDMYDSDPLKLMEYLLPKLSQFNLQFLELKRHGVMDSSRISQVDKTKDQLNRILPKIQIPDFFKTLRPLYNGVIVGNDGFTPDSAQKAIDNGEFDLISFGKFAINNPDLPLRSQNKQQIDKKMDMNTWFEGGQKGYTTFKQYA